MQGGGADNNERSSRRNNTIRQAPAEKGPDLTDSMRNLTIDEKNATGGDQKGSNGRRASGSQSTRLPGMEERKEGRPETINYDAQRMVGHGSFGAVFQAKVVETNEVVAIKKVLQDRRFKNRELQIMRQLSKQPHPYVVLLKHYFVSKGSKADEVYLNLVLEYIPETVHSVAKMFSRAKEPMPMLSIKIYMYQLSRALAHIHGMGICHRDIKPQNLLVDPSRQVLKLCDFGSAKALIKGEPNVAYICSRYYRAPELIFGSTEYTTAIDVWSEGCVLAELLIGTPVFPGSSGVDQLVEIIKVLGTPTKEELTEMNPNYQEFRFPQIRAVPWASIFKPGTPPEAMDLASKLLVYKPLQRYLAIEACGHPFFDDLRNPATPLTDPHSMFTFTDEELLLAPQMRSVLIPPHMRTEQSQQQQQQQQQSSNSESFNESGNGSQSNETNPNNSTPSVLLPSTSEEGV